MSSEISVDIVQDHYTRLLGDLDRLDRLAARRLDGDGDVCAAMRVQCRRLRDGLSRLFELEDSLLTRAGLGALIARHRVRRIWFRRTLGELSSNPTTAPAVARAVLSVDEALRIELEHQRGRIHAGEPRRRASV